MKIRGYDLINRGYAAAFNQPYGVEVRISPVCIEHSDIRPIIPPSVRAGFRLERVSRDATDHIALRITFERVMICQSVRIARGVRISESAFPVIAAFVVASYFVFLWIWTANAYETN